MARAFAPKIVTASDLLEGDVIYMTADGSWSRAHRDAALADTTELAEAMLKRAEAQQDRLVGAYLAEANPDGSGAPEPVHYREIIRTVGPSNYFHGKQAGA